MVIQWLRLYDLFSPHYWIFETVDYFCDFDFDFFLFMPDEYIRYDDFLTN